MVHLDLNENDVKTMIGILESYLSDLRMEIANTDRLAFRDMLRERKELIGRVLTALREEEFATHE